MTDIATATAAGIKFRDMILKPILIAEIGELEAWAQGNVLKQTAEAIRDTGIEGEGLRVMLHESFEERRRLRFLTIEGQQLILQSMGGIARLIWLSARSSDPSLTFEDVTEKIGGIDDADEIANEILRQSGFTDDGSDVEKKTVTGNGQATT